jgi:hypothetical protein
MNFWLLEKKAGRIAVAQNWRRETRIKRLLHKCARFILWINDAGLQLMGRQKFCPCVIRYSLWDGYHRSKLDGALGTILPLP